MSERVRIDLLIQLITSFFQAFLQFLCPLCCSYRAQARVPRSLFTRLNAPLESLPSFGRFRIDDFRLGIPVIAIQSEWQEPVFDNVLLDQPPMRVQCN